MIQIIICYHKPKFVGRMILKWGIPRMASVFNDVPYLILWWTDIYSKVENGINCLRIACIERQWDTNHGETASRLAFRNIHQIPKKLIIKKFHSKWSMKLILKMLNRFFLWANFTILKTYIGKLKCPYITKFGLTLFGLTKFANFFKSPNLC